MTDVFIGAATVGIVVFCAVAAYAACVVSGKCSREEEEWETRTGGWSL